MKDTHKMNESLESMFIVDPFNDEAATNSDKINQMKKVMYGILNYSLTDRQRQIFEMYYRDKLKMPGIAKILGISKMAVSKSLSDSKKKIRKMNESKYQTSVILK